ncbi:MAG TPA: class I SAM-dependent methyltransferase [Myxococcales bacterium]|nr:class I SAM-dependent methyltransferase [Myxococcales bacterium]
MESRLLMGLRSRLANFKQLGQFAPRFAWRLATLRLGETSPAAEPNAVSRYTGIFRRDDVDRLRPTLERLRAFDPYLLWATEFLPDDGWVQKAWELAIISTYVSNLTDDLTGKEALDIGSGNSTFPVYLSECLGANAVSFDLPNPNALRLGWSVRQYEKYGVRRDEGDMLSLPYPDDSWDLVTNISVIEHLNWRFEEGLWKTVTNAEFNQRTIQCLSEMCRVCRPGGLVYVTSDILTAPIEDEQPDALRTITGYSLKDIHEHWIPTVEQHHMSMVEPEPFDAAALQESIDTGREVPSHHKRPFAFLLKKKA